MCARGYDQKLMTVMLDSKRKLGDLPHMIQAVGTSRAATLRAGEAALPVDLIRSRLFFDLSTMYRNAKHEKSHDDDYGGASGGGD